VATNVRSMSEGASGGDEFAAVDGFAAGRRLTGGETAFWYGLAGVSYVALSIFHKFLLNWFIGPLWLVAVVWLGPLLVDRARARVRGVR
jgi:energy-converting hydrogenase Eha subunit G